MNYLKYLSAAALMLQSVALSAADSADIARAQELMQRGSYGAAIEVYRIAASESQRDVINLSRAYALTGQYEEAVAVCEAALGDYAESPLIATQLAEVKRATGQSAEALDILEAASEAVEVPVRTLVQRGSLLQLMGRGDEAAPFLEESINRYNNGLVFDSAEVAMVARASWLLNRFQDANTLFNEAVRTDPANLEAQVLWGNLFVEKYNVPDAERSYSEALELNPNYVPALIGMAHTDQGQTALDRALRINPRSAVALETYGKLLIDNQREEEGRDYLQRALEVNPESIPALGGLAALAALNEEDQEYEALLARVERFSPDNAEFFGLIADAFGSNYRFEEAVEFARRSVEADPRYWQGYTLLGNNLIRLGEEEEGKQHLELAFSNDPFNVLTSNLLKVFDTLEEYAVLRSEHFEVHMSHRDADILWPYLEPLLEESWDTLTAKYGFEPEYPVLIEMFENSEDFSVRSVGLPDIGPLVGICFGKVITLISPDALSANWQEIVWHEFMHVITLQMTRNRMPRWLSEGISVWEEKEARPEWGRSQGIELVRAVGQGKLLDVGDLNSGFSGAQSNADLGFAYFQSYLVVDYIADQYGFDKLVALIKEYAEIQDENDMFLAVFDESLEEFDAGFRAWIEQRVEEIDIYVHQEDMPDEGAGHGHGVRSNSSAVLAELYNNASLKQHMRQRIESQPKDFQAHLQLGIVLFKEDNFNEAERHLLRAHELLPDYTGYPSPALVLSQIYERQGDRQAQLEQLEILLRNQQHNYDAAITLAEAALSERNYEKGSYYLDRAVAIDPYHLDVHRLQADLAEQTQDYELAVRELEILVMLDMNDPVEARTSLAQAYLGNAQQEEARREVLRALEIAPGYERAQQVLLQAVEQGDQ